jgi:crotonobetainyl-CoA:carnitine CoA-transferase CaiB-like acyl-CoA transferase
MHADPQVRAREMVVEVEHATLGSVRTLGLPVKFSDTPGEVRTGAPVYGQHTREVLRAHGFAEPDIEELLAEGAIAILRSE